MKNRLTQVCNETVSLIENASTVEELLKIKEKYLSNDGLILSHLIEVEELDLNDNDKEDLKNEIHLKHKNIAELFANKLKTLKREKLPQLLRYRNNSISFWLCMLAILFNVLAFLKIYEKASCTPDFILGIDVVINILVLLGCFVCAEEVKAYRKNFAYFSFVIAVLQIARIFIVPLKHVDVLSAEVNLFGNAFIYLIILYVVSAASLIVSGIICIKRGNILQDYLNKLEEGN